MAFKTRPSVYRIDIAPTSRARCRGPCKQTICKGDFRIAITAFVRPNRSTLLKRGDTASPEVVARTRTKRDSLKAAEMRTRKPAKIKARPERKPGERAPEFRVQSLF